MDNVDVKERVSSSLSLAWALVPVAAIFLFVAAGREPAASRAAAQAEAAAAAVDITPAPHVAQLVPARLDAPASADEPLARYGQ